MRACGRGEDACMLVHHCIASVPDPYKLQMSEPGACSVAGSAAACARWRAWMRGALTWRTRRLAAAAAGQPMRRTCALPQPTATPFAVRTRCYVATRACCLSALLDTSRYCIIRCVPYVSTFKLPSPACVRRTLAGCCCCMLMRAQGHLAKLGRRQGAAHRDSVQRGLQCLLPLSGLLACI